MSCIEVDCVVTFTLPDATVCFSDATGALLDEEGDFILDETAAIIYED